MKPQNNKCGKQRYAAKIICTNETFLVGRWNFLQLLVKILLQLNFPIGHCIPKRTPQPNRDDMLPRICIDSHKQLHYPPNTIEHRKETHPVLQTRAHTHILMWETRPDTSTRTNMSKTRVVQSIHSEEEITPILPPEWIMVFLHIRVGHSLYVVSKWVSRDLKNGPQVFSFQRWTPCTGTLTQVTVHLSIYPQGRAPRSPTWLVETSCSTGYFHYGWTIGARVHRKWSALKATHPSYG